MNIFGKEEKEPQAENTKVISNSLGIDLGRRRDRWFQSQKKRG